MHLWLFVLLAQTGAIRVYFSHNLDPEAVRYPGAYEQVRLDTLWAAYLDSATASIDLAVYSLTSWDVRDALIAAHQRGLRVRVIVDNERWSPEVQALADAGIPVISDAFGENPGTYAMHNKFAVLDFRDSSFARPWVIVGSFNPTYGGALHDANNLLVIRDREVARAFTLEFEEMWGDTSDLPNPQNARFGPRKTDNTPHLFSVEGTPVEVYFSPSDGIRPQIAQEIAAAEDALLFCLYFFTDDFLSARMRERWEAGVLVAGVFDSTNWLDPAGLSASWEMTGHGPEGWDPPAPVYPDSIRGGLLHHKYLVADPFSESRATVVTGSANWTYSAAVYNDEVVVILHSPVVANWYYAEFSARYEEAGGTPPVGVAERAEGRGRRPPEVVIFSRRELRRWLQGEPERRLFTLQGRRVPPERVLALPRGMYLLSSGRRVLLLR